MSPSDLESDRLRERFQNPPEGARSGPDCPAPEAILAAVLGPSSARENRSIAEHCGVCPSCTIAWRLARDHAGESGLSPEGEAESSRSPGLRWLPAAAALAAAVLLVAVLLPRIGEERSSEPVLRTLEQDRVVSGLPPDARLSAESFVLRWEPGPEGTRYRVRVTDRRLEPLAGADSLAEPEYTVPPDSLAEMSSGSPVLWQVEAILPDGRRIVSETFVAHLE